MAIMQKVELVEVVDIRHQAMVEAVVVDSLEMDNIIIIIVIKQVEKASPTV